MVFSIVIEDVFVVVESLVRNQCKGKSCNFLFFNPLPPIFFSNFFFFFSTFMQVGSSWFCLF